MKRNKRKNLSNRKKKEEVKPQRTDLFEESDNEPIELGLGFYKWPAIIAVALTAIFYTLVLIFVK